MDSPGHNPYLRPQATPTDGPAKGSIDRPGEIPNFAWQTRAASPTDFENRLGDAFETIFDAGIVDPPGIIARLQELGIAHPDGAAWTEDRFLTLMHRLGERGQLSA